MLVREYMKSPVITVNPETLLDDAARIMHQNRIRRLPVVDNGKLVGLITRYLLREATPPSPTPLSIWGLHYQLAKMTVQDVMISEVITVHPDTTIEETAALGEQRKIGTFPVVDNEENLVGILTATDIYHLFTQVLGLGRKGVRLHIHDVDGKQHIHHHQIMETLSRHPVDVLSTFSVLPPGTQQEDFIVHLDTEEAGAIVADLKKLGLDVDVRHH